MINRFCGNFFYEQKYVPPLTSISQQENTPEKEKFSIEYRVYPAGITISRPWYVKNNYNDQWIHYRGIQVKARQGLVMVHPLLNTRVTSRDTGGIERTDPAALWRTGPKVHIILPRRSGPAITFFTLFR